MSKIQDMYYNNLVEELKNSGLNVDEKVESFLFDYIYNSIEEEGFDEYLERFRK